MSKARSRGTSRALRLARQAVRNERARHAGEIAALNSRINSLSVQMNAAFEAGMTKAIRDAALPLKLEKMARVLFERRFDDPALRDAAQKVMEALDKNRMRGPMNWDKVDFSARVDQTVRHNYIQGELPSLFFRVVIEEWP